MLHGEKWKGTALRIENVNNKQKSWNENKQKESMTYNLSMIESALFHHTASSPGFVM